MTRWSGSEEGEPPSSRRTDDEAIGALRATMSRHVGVVRERAGLTEALSTIERLAERVHGPQVRNALVAAKLIAAAALTREESRGSHYRSDYPLPDPDFAVRTFMTLEQAEAVAARREYNADAAPPRIVSADSARRRRDAGVRPQRRRADAARSLSDRATDRIRDCCQRDCATHPIGLAASTQG